MDGDSARALKRDFLFDVGAGTSQARPAPVRAAAEAIGLAVGLSPTADGGYRLAVRAFDDAWAQSPQVARLRDAALGELDVRVVGEIHAQPDPPPGQAPTDRLRPLVPGCSVGHVDVTAGTLGCFVRVDGAAAILSNNHVLAATDRAELGDVILQPGRVDGGEEPQDRIGTLSVAQQLTGRPDEIYDVAVATLDSEDLVSANTFPEGALCGLSDEPLDGELVAKVGRTTGHTTGRITAVEIDGISVGYGGGRLITFDGVTEIESAGEGPFSRGGDSGSVVYTSCGLLGFGLLFAGSSTGGSNGAGLTYASSLPAAMAAVGATLL